MARPIVILGCGRLGSAIVEGWLATGAIDTADLVILTPSSKPVAEAARARRARINPPLETLGEARAVVLAVKPAMWREAAASLAGTISSDTVVVSVMAGVKAADLAEVFAGSVARVMPTTAVAQGRGVAAIWSASDVARALAHSLFDPLADVVDLDDEALMDAATAVAGSAPAFIHVFVRALATAGTTAGLAPADATRLARGALRSAAAGLDTDQTLEDMIARIASPGGTTRAGLDAMATDVDRVAAAAVIAAIERAGELG